MRYTWILILLLIIPAATGCPGAQGQSGAEKHLMQLFGTYPVIGPYEFHETGVAPFNGNYPLGWPSQIQVPPGATLLLDGAIAKDDGLPNCYTVYFTYTGNARDLAKTLQDQAAAAGYTEENPRWTENMDYSFAGIEGYIRMLPGTEKAFSYYCQTFPNTPNTMWEVTVTW